MSPLLILSLACNLSLQPNSAPLSTESATMTARSRLEMQSDTTAPGSTSETASFETTTEAPTSTGTTVTTTTAPGTETTPETTVATDTTTTEAAAPTGRGKRERYFDEEDEIEDWELLADELLEEGELADYESWFILLEEIKLSPLNLNTVTFDSLNMLGLLSERQIENILRFRDDYGGFKSINELLFVNGIGPKQVGALRPLLYVDEEGAKDRVTAIKKGLKNEMIYKMRGTIPRSEGFKDGRYPGRPFGTLVKYKGTLNKRWSAGFTAESDPGEKFFTHTQRVGFDFISAYISHASDRPVSLWVAGDYSVQWGQGLVLWQGFSTSDVSSVTGIEKSAAGIKGYSSSSESGYFRGLAANIQATRRLSFQLFASMNRIDGKVVDADTLTDAEEYASTLYTSGYHRTETERNGKREVREYAVGANAMYNHPAFRIDLHYLFYNYDPPVGKSTQLYQKYNDTGHHRSLVGLSWKTSFAKIYFSGEVAVSEKGATAITAGLRRNFDPIGLGISYRRYDKRYQSSYASASGTYSNSSNEEGVLFIAECSPIQNLQIRGSVDYYHFFSARYRATIPDNGLKISGEVIYKTNNWQHQLTIRYKRRPEEITANFPSHRNNTDIKYQANWTLSKKWELRGRVQLDFMERGQHDLRERESGYMISADAIFHASKDKFKIQSRLAYFNIDSYYSRIYLYENNVLYGYSTPAFQGKGVRWYANLSYKPLKNFTIYAKAGITAMPGTDSRGTGADKTMGPRRTDITAQLRYTF